jgi:hypothetical protein
MPHKPKVYLSQTTGLVLPRRNNKKSILMRVACINASLVSLLLVAAVRADEGLLFQPDMLRLESYEPNTIGYTKDSDDVGFMDFKVSVKYELFPDLVSKLSSDFKAYFAFTGRFGQYIGTRESSPVVGKRFNPKFIFRDITRSGAAGSDENAPKSGADEYFDFAYAHESNGQSITSLAEYDQARANSERPEFANDNISRGWDYLEFTWKNVPSYTENHKLSTYLTLQYFLQRGLLQDAPEEYNSWENDPEGKPRKSVNGVRGIVKYQPKYKFSGWFSDPKYALIYETGYQHIFKYNTIRAEVGIKIQKLPVTLWGRTGYGSDLALYYKKVSSYGIEVEIGSF